MLVLQEFVTGYHFGSLSYLIAAFSWQYLYISIYKIVNCQIFAVVSEVISCDLSPWCLSPHCWFYLHFLADYYHSLVTHCLPIPICRMSMVSCFCLITVPSFFCHASSRSKQPVISGWIQSAQSCCMKSRDHDGPLSEVDIII